MKEITCKLRFLTPCLGHIRHDDCDLFERDATGMVIFRSSWWRSLLDYGAKALGKHQKKVRDIRIHPRIDGEPQQYNRYFKPHKFKTHEAYMPKQTVGIKVMLPDGLPVEDFRTLFQLGGHYKGISPYQGKDQNEYGLFDLLEITEG